MRRRLGIVSGAAVWLALAGCSSPNDAAKSEPKPAAMKTGPAPEVFQVRLDTSKGEIVVEVRRAWAPIGADHFYSLVSGGFYDGARFFRVLRNFVVQFGINGDPKVNRIWNTGNLKDDPVKERNVQGTLTYAHAGPHTRTTQLFINLKDNSRMLDGQGFAPIGKVISGMTVLEFLYDSYGEMAPRGAGPDPRLIETQGNEYLSAQFPRLDYIKRASVQ
jgi:peptidyl-prolyl cis-trans isomerase A (cyclophilin A)